MISLLCRINQERNAPIEQCARAFPPEAVSAFETDYENMIFQGHEENKETKHLYAQKDEKALLNRMEKYHHNHLLFLHNVVVSFDNNMSERNLRKAKNRQKMASGFHKASGHEMYCSILASLKP